MSVPIYCHGHASDRGKEQTYVPYGMDTVPRVKWLPISRAQESLHGKIGYPMTALCRLAFSWCLMHWRASDLVGSRLPTPPSRGDLRVSEHFCSSLCTHGGVRADPAIGAHITRSGNSTAVPACNHTGAGGASKDQFRQPIAYDYGRVAFGEHDIM